MLNEARLRSLYSKLQTQLFYMIPEKWDSIYLYASIEQKMNNLEAGEMFFYYFPKGILKKNPVNVYEIPSKFNIDVNAYMKLADELYDTIKLLRLEYEKAKEELWTNLTISIENLQFKIEYDYENLQKSNYSNYDRHIIWKYKYLNIALERLSKRDRNMIEYYLNEEQFKNKITKKYTENMYRKNIHNIVEYGRKTNTYEDLEENYQEETIFENKKNLDKYELYKLKQKEQIKKEKEEIDRNDISKIIESQKQQNKNQILSFK